jgi:hypothetical protein
VFGLNALLGLDYDIYISFMKRCGLIISFKHNRSRTIVDVPSINKSGYTWNDFISEFELSFIEVAYVCSRSSNNKRTYYVRVGQFENKHHFTINDQLRGYGNNVKRRLRFGCRAEQKALVSSLAEVDITHSVPPPSILAVNEASVTTVDHVASTGESSKDNNFKLLLQSHFFD